MYWHISLASIAGERFQLPAFSRVPRSFSRANYFRLSGRSPEEKQERHEERLAAVQRKSEVTRLQDLMKHEELLECLSRNKALASQERAEKAAQERAEKEREQAEAEERRRAEDELLFPRRKKRPAAG
jgi:hypothetical protein